MSELSANDALRIIEAGRKASTEFAVNTSIAVVDRGGHLLAFLRMDNALLASLEVSQVKARTGFLFGTDTRNLPFDKPFTPALLGAVSSPLAFIPGGVPLRDGNSLIGAVGVGGGSGEQDHAIAVAAALALAPAQTDGSGIMANEELPT